jgi:hypothetical protein
MNMTVTYKFRSLNELAAYYDGKAQELRERLVRMRSSKAKQIDIARVSGEALSLEMVVHQLRNTTITGEAE